ncbi:enterochelin esterase, partial [Alphaproteobacteria bacterium]|nr:enterochelin esterase [Alphaproteobacteria bacterium]
MARLFSQDYPKGSVTRINVNASAQLKNQLGDPTEREVLVYHPADYNGEDVPIIIDLPPFTGSGLSRAGFRPFSESVTDILDRLWAEGKIPPALYVFPDTYTRLGGTPFTPSSILGDQGAF